MLTNWRPILLKRTERGSSLTTPLLTLISQVCYNFTFCLGDFNHSLRTLLEKDSKAAGFGSLEKATSQQNVYGLPRKDVFVTWICGFGDTVGDFMTDAHLRMPSCYRCLKFFFFPSPRDSLYFFACWSFVEKIDNL
jgi:hypothetical protein